MFVIHASARYTYTVILWYCDGGDADGVGDGVGGGVNCWETIHTYGLIFTQFVYIIFSFSSKFVILVKTFELLNFKQFSVKKGKSV